MKKEYLYLFIRAKLAIFLLCSGLFFMHYPTSKIFEPQASLDDIENELKEAGSKVVDRRNALGQTGVMYAIMMDDYGLFKLLIDFGADVDARSENPPRQEDVSFNNTPLHFATLQVNNRHNMEMIRDLVDAGANVNPQNSLGETPLMWSLQIALVKDREQVTRELIEDLADVNVQNNRGDTYLHETVRNFDIEWTRYLMDAYGSMFDLDLKNNEGWTAEEFADNLIEAWIRDYIRNRELVGDYGQVQERDILGRTGLMLAIIRNDLPFAQDQLKDRSDIHALDETRFGNQPIHFTVIRRYNMIPFVRLVLEYKANPNARNRYGDTPLHYLVKYNIDNVNILERDETAKILIEAGADPHQKNNEGESAIQKALKKDPAFAEQLNKWFEQQQKAEKGKAGTD